jgi:uncharacterized protein YwgA
MSVAEKIIEFITGRKVTLQLTKDQTEFEVIDEEDKEALKVEVIYITAQTRNTVKEKVLTRLQTEDADPTNPQTPAYLPFVKIVPREECVKYFGVRFEGIDTSFH